MKLEYKRIKGRYCMWAIDGTVINGREFHSFCRTEKTKPSQISLAQILKYLAA